MEKDFQSELEKMDNRLTELESKIDNIDSKLSQVVDALIGNPLMGKAAGLVNKVNNLEKEIEELRDFRKRIIYTVSAIVSLGLIIEFLIKTYAGLQK
jgi:archaellum component FlaC